MKTEAYLTQLADLRAPSALEAEIAALAKGGAKIALDPVLAADRLRTLVTENGGAVVTAPDPARIPRATKNSAEIAGARAAHRRDGAAVAKLLCWLDAPGAGHARRDRRRDQARGDAARRPARKRRCRCAKSPSPRSPAPGRTARSCTTACRATPTGRSKSGELFLLDSGGQYQDGTTDITRTVPIGQPTEEMRTRYTLVLKGMIGISMLRFPAGVRGSDTRRGRAAGAVEGRPRLCARHRPRRRLLSVGA